MTAVLAACASSHAPTTSASDQFVNGPAGTVLPRVPGTINLAVTQANIATTICKKGWTATVRPPEAYTEALKRKQMREYGETGPLGAYEEDHRVPLEVGGNPTNPQNLWPQPHEDHTVATWGSETKDRLENLVKQEVCSRYLTLSQGQALFLNDWHQSWIKVGRP